MSGTVLDAHFDSKCLFGDAWFQNISKYIFKKNCSSVTRFQKCVLWNDT